MGIKPNLGKLWHPVRRWRLSSTRWWSTWRKRQGKIFCRQLCEVGILSVFLPIVSSLFLMILKNLNFYSQHDPKDRAGSFAGNYIFEVGMVSCKMSTSQFDPYKVFKVYNLFSVFVQNKILNSILSTPLPALTIFRSWSLSETFPSEYPKFV